MKFIITGADKDTGDPIEMTVDATSESAAREIAHRKGVLVSTVVPASAAIVEPPPQRMTQRPHGSAPQAYHPRLEHGHVRGAPVINVAAPRRGSSLGVAAVILGVLAFLVCWIPLVGMLSIVLGSLGMILGVLGVLVSFTRRGSGIGLGIAGTVVAGLALVVAVGLNMAIMDVVNTVGNSPVVTNSVPTPSTAIPDLAEDRRRRAVEQGEAKQPNDAARPAIPPAAAQPETLWVTADKPAQVGDVWMHVLSARVASVKIQQLGEERTTKDEFLQITLEITNLHDSKKLEYISWRPAMFSTNNAILTDTFGNSYRSIPFDMTTKVIGGVSVEAIYPGRWIQDIIVFEPPVDKAGYLNLELSGRAVKQDGGDGKEGTFRIRIPASMIEKE